MERSLSIVFAVVCLLIPATSQAQNSDRFSLYFDAELTVSTLETDAFPYLGTAYLVLENPSVPRVGGWECWVRTEGSVALANWSIEGEHHNFMSTPNFFVALGAPLPADDRILLATCDVWVGQVGPGTISLEPIYSPSVPGSMSYMSFDDNEVLVPVASGSGGPVAARVNPACLPGGDAMPTYLDFDVPLGTTRSQGVTIANTGTCPLPVRPQFAGPAGVFAIEGPAGVQLIGPGEVVQFAVTCTGTELGTYTCEITCAENTPPVAVSATVREPVGSWTVSQNPVRVFKVEGQPFEPVEFRVINTGDVAQWLDPELVADPGVFVVTSQPAGFPTLLDPGRWATFTVELGPVGHGRYEGVLDLGDIPGEVTLIGSYEEPYHEYVADPDTIDFGILSRDAPSKQMRFDFLYTGNVPVETVMSVEPQGKFELISPRSTVYFRPETSREIEIRVSGYFGPGRHTGHLLPGSGMDPWPLVFEVPEYLDCYTDPDTLNFGVVGMSANGPGSAIIVNLGHEYIHIEPVIADTVVTADGAYAQDLSPGDQVHFHCSYRPREVGHLETTMEFGGDRCSPLVFIGEAVPDPGADGVSNRVAFSFADSSLVDRISNVEPGSIIRGYIKLQQPSTALDLWNWNLDYDLAPTVEIVDVQPAEFVHSNEDWSCLGGFYPIEPLTITDGMVLAAIDLRVTGEGPAWIRLRDRSERFRMSVSYRRGDQVEHFTLHSAATDTVSAWITPGTDPGAPAAVTPEATRLLPNYPNPFNAGTVISFELQRESRLRIVVYDLNGRRVAVLRDTHQAAGSDQVSWAGRDGFGRPVPSGAYYVRLEADGLQDVRKIMLLK